MQIAEILKTKQIRRKSTLHSDAHILAEEISTYCREPKRFALYLGVIKRIGTSRARAILRHIKENQWTIKNPARYFLAATRNK
jgi:hypothetical protein